MNSLIIATKFITANHEHSIVAIGATLIMVDTMPKQLPTKYSGMNILVAGSNTVNVSIALAVISSTVSASSQ
jgi:hypothetical protein